MQRMVLGRMPNSLSVKRERKREDVVMQKLNRSDYKDI